MYSIVTLKFLFIFKDNWMLSTAWAWSHIIWPGSRNGIQTLVLTHSDLFNQNRTQEFLVSANFEGTWQEKAFDQQCSFPTTGWPKHFPWARVSRDPLPKLVLLLQTLLMPVPSSQGGDTHTSSLSFVGPSLSMSHIYSSHNGDQKSQQGHEEICLDKGGWKNPQISHEPY